MVLALTPRGAAFLTATESICSTAQTFATANFLGIAYTGATVRFRYADAILATRAFRGATNFAATLCIRAAANTIAATCATLGTYNAATIGLQLAHPIHTGAVWTTAPFSAEHSIWCTAYFVVDTLVGPVAAHVPAAV